MRQSTRNWNIEQNKLSKNIPIALPRFNDSNGLRFKIAGNFVKNQRNIETKMNLGDSKFVNRNQNQRLSNGAERSSMNGLIARSNKEKSSVNLPTLGNDKYLSKESSNGVRYSLRPQVEGITVAQPVEKLKIDYSNEDMNGPYNFRKFLRPAEYLPTESLRKRKGGLSALNGISITKQTQAENNFKRRAPLAPVNIQRNSSNVK